MHCAPFLLTMQIIFASVSYRRVVADLRMNNHAAQYEIVSIDSVKVKVNYKLEKTKVSHSEKWDTFVIYSCTNQQTV